MAAWTPTMLPGLTIWLDASNLAQADGVALSSFTDRSGNGRHATQATGANQPLVKTNVQNGLRVVRFDGTDDFMDMGNSLGMDTLPFSFASVHNRMRVGVGNSDLWTAKNVAGPFQTNGEDYAYISGDNNGYLLYTVSNDEAMNIHTGIFQGEGSHASINGVADYTPDDRPFGTAALNTGAYLGAGQLATLDFMFGDLGELLFSARAWSTATRQKVEGYLAWKWGLTANLPSGHPYKSVAPTDGPTTVMSSLRRARAGSLRGRKLRGE